MADSIDAVHMRSQVFSLLKIAVPLVVAYLAEYLMFVISKVIVGELGYQELAAVGIATDLSFELAVVSMAFLSVAGVFIANSEGAGNRPLAGQHTRQCLWLATLLAVPLMFFVWHLPTVLSWLGQDPIVVRLTKPYLHNAVFFLLPLLWFSVLRSYVSALSHAGIIMVISILAIPLNYLLTRGLVHGEFGLPGLGVAGAGLAFSLINWLMLVMLVIYIAVHRRFRDYRVFQQLFRERPDMSLWYDIVKLGLPVAGLVALEAGLFVAVSVLSGLFGVDALASYQIIMSWVGVPFVIAFGIANATMVRVAYGMGTQDHFTARRAGIVGIVLGLILVIALVIVPLNFPQTIVALFLQPADPGFQVVSELVSRLLLLVAFFQVFDGLQSISSHALRGLKDTFVPLWIAAIGYWVIGIAGGSLLAFGFGIGVEGLWWGLACGLTITGTLLARRFLRLTADQAPSL
ncbi:MAG: MATE family efflux transporter [Granulosicoccus sp.]|nr:MATE family efflux transporter [Granulosicoccus sp.]